MSHNQRVPVHGPTESLQFIWHNIKHFFALKRAESRQTPTTQTFSSAKICPKMLKTLVKLPLNY